MESIFWYVLAHTITEIPFTALSMDEHKWKENEKPVEIKKQTDWCYLFSFISCLFLLSVKSLREKSKVNEMFFCCCLFSTFLFFLIQVLVPYRWGRVFELSPKINQDYYISNYNSFSIFYFLVVAVFFFFFF